MADETFGTGKVTLQRLALELGLSTATVSLALRDSPVVAEATRLKVQDVARARGYVANRGAASLRTARTNIVGVGLHDIINPSFTELLAAMEDALSAAGKTVLLGVGQEDVARQTRILGTLAEYRPDALIVSPAMGTGVEDLRALANSGVPIVQVTREVEGSGFDFAGSDDVTGVSLAVSHLVELGHQRIAMIGGFEAASTGRRRLAGYQAGLARHGSPMTPPCGAGARHARAGAPAGGAPARLAGTAHGGGLLQRSVRVRRPHGRAGGRPHGGHGFLHRRL